MKSPHKIFDRYRYVCVLSAMSGLDLTSLESLRDLRGLAARGVPRSRRSQPEALSVFRTDTEPATAVLPYPYRLGLGGAKEGDQTLVDLLNGSDFGRRDLTNPGRSDTIPKYPSPINTLLTGSDQHGFSWPQLEDPHTRKAAKASSERSPATSTRTYQGQETKVSRFAFNAAAGGMVRDIERASFTRRGTTSGHRAISRPPHEEDRTTETHRGLETIASSGPGTSGWDNSGLNRPQPYPGASQQPVISGEIWIDTFTIQDWISDYMRMSGDTDFRSRLDRLSMY